MKKQRQHVLFLIAIVVMLLLAACGNEDPTPEGEASSGEPKDGGDLIIGTLNEPDSFISLYSTGTNSSRIQNLMFNGLVYLDEESEPQSDLATEWSQSDDGLTWTFHLEESVDWHDGEHFTAEDVVFTFQIPLHEDYSGSRSAFFNHIESIQALDDYTVEITLEYADPAFLYGAATYNILPKHILGEVEVADIPKHPFNTKEPIGTGPFKFDEWKQAQYVRVVANENYFEGRPHLDSITSKEIPDKNSIMAQFQAGDIDYVELSTEDVPTGESLVEQGKAEIQSSPNAGYSYMLYNLKNPLFQDKKVRQALAHGLDREAIIDNVLQGNGKVTHIPGADFMWAFNEDAPQFNYDPERAKELLAEAGWEPGKDGILEKDGEKFKFTISSNQGNKVREKIMLIAQQQWGELGIDVVTEIIESSALREMTHNFDYDMSMQGWSIQLDPGNLYRYFHTDEIEDGVNKGAYSNPELDKLFDEANREMDREKRKELIEEQHAIIAEDQPYLFLYQPERHALYSKQLNGVEMHPKAELYNVHKWWME